MSEPAIRVEGLSKCYQLGAIGRHTLVDEMQHLWCKIRGRDPSAVMGKVFSSAVSQRSDKEFWALKDVSFEVRAGEVLGVIGGNGAGKSTLLKILSRITEPTAGGATIRGRVGSLLEVGTGFHPELTGRENVFMNGTILGMKRREVAAKFDEIVAFSGIEKFIDTPVKRYSSGMYVRLAFAVAAHLEPEILVVDEVLAVGDAEFQKRCLGKMGEVANAGRTVLFVSHNMAAVRRLCSNCLWLIDGKVARTGDVSVVEEYLHASHEGALAVGGRVDRVEKEHMVLSEIELVKGNGGRTNRVNMGEGIGLRMVVCSKVDMPVASIQFALFDESGNRIAALHSQFTHLESLSLKKGTPVEVRATIASMNLNSGNYFVNLGVSDLVLKGNSFLLEKVLSFEVVPRDVHGVNVTPQKDAVVFFPVQWEFSGCDV
ncbi:MAG: ABC transporter ATP-binding protein [Kiritimatiellae bacterium]|nr:ABC transporter ATP-binding protein [Kiritimatiellia bacterium]